MAQVLLDFIQATATGLQQALRKQLDEALMTDSIDVGRKKNIIPLVELLRRLYREPSLRSWLTVVAEIAASPPTPLSMFRPEAAVLLGRLRTASLSVPR